MITFRVTPRVQIIVLYLLAVFWNAIWMTGRVSIKGPYNAIWHILFVAIPLIYVWLAIRLTFYEERYLKEHPRAFDGALGLACLPIGILILLICCS
jgi:hypothetical protein